MSWEDKHVAFDFETSGTKPEYALQPWRVAQGDAWATSLAIVKRENGATVISGGLSPTASDMRLFLQTAINAGRRIVGWNTIFDIAWLLAYGLDDLVFQVKWLDGMLVWKHLTIEPEYKLALGKKKSYGLKSAVREFIPQAAGYEQDVDFHTTDPVGLQRLHNYNVADTAFTLRLAGKFYAQLTPAQRRACLIEAECLPHVAQANLRGMLVDTIQSHELRAKLRATRDREKVKLQAIGVDPNVVRSPMKLAEVLFDKWGLFPLKSTGAGARSTDKEVLVELSHVDPRVKSLLTLREAGNLETKFATRLVESVSYNGDDMTRPQAIVFGTYCVPGDVEVLTRQGWVQLDRWSGGDIVQARPDLTLEFLPATRHDAGIVSSWVEIPKLRSRFTDEHTIPYLAQKTFAWRTQLAKDMIGVGEVKNIPVAGYLNVAGRFTPDQMRLFAAIQADGSFVSKKYKGEPYSPDLKFCFKKPRKIERLRMLLTACGVTYREYVSATYPDRTEFHVARGNFPEWLTSERKFFGAWLLDTTQEGLQALVDEVVHWDGSPHPDGGVKYTSFVRENVAWVVTIAALCGRKASIHQDVTAHISYARPIRACRPRDNRRIIGQSEPAFCPVTETGFWLARSNGVVFVTGNSGRMTYASKQVKDTKRDPAGKILAKREELPTGFAIHQMKNGPDFRGQVVAPPGYEIMEFDASGQEFRWMAIGSGDTTMLTLCQKGEDAHTFMGARIAERDYRGMQLALKSDDAIIKKLAGDQRKLGKVGNLSLQYRTSPARLRSVARMPPYNIPMEMPQARLIHATYQRAYPRVPIYWRTQIEDTKKRGYVETFAGRRVAVVGDWFGPMGWSMESTAINYRIQGTGADMKYLALAVIQHYMAQNDILYGWDLHDGIYLLAPVGNTEKHAVNIKKQLDNLPYREAWGFTPPVPLPWDAKAGFSWGSLRELEI